MGNEVKTKCWYFTFGQSSDIYGDMANRAVKVYANSYGEARQKMFDYYGSHWGFQYSEEEWEKMKNDPSRYWPMEEVTGVIK